MLEGIDWGWVRITETGGFIEITHGAYPLVPQDEHRRSWLVPTLEGIYTEWMTGQGGDPSCSARLAETPPKSALRCVSATAGTTKRADLPADAAIRSCASL